MVEDMLERDRLEQDMLDQDMLEANTFSVEDNKKEVDMQ